MAKSFLQQKKEAQNMMLTPKSVIPKPTPVPVRNNVVHNQARTGASLPVSEAVTDGPSLPLGKLRQGTKEWLYGMKDDDLTPGLIISKYQFVADDTSMDYDRKRKMIKEGQKSLGKLRNQEAFNRLLGRSVTNYGQQAADLDAKLGAQLKSSAFGSGFFDAFGLGRAHKGTHFIADQLNKPELTQAIDQDRQFIEEAKKTNPQAANTGSFAGGLTRDAGLYFLEGPLVTASLARIGARFPKVGALVNKNPLTKFGANVLGQQALDTAVMQPVVALRGVGESKSGEQIWEEMKQQALMDLLFNTGMGVAGEGVKAIGKGVRARRTAKELAAQQAEEAAKNVRSFSTGDMPLPDMDMQTDPFYRVLLNEQPKAVNEAFSGKGQTGNTVLHEKMNASGAAGTSKNISSMDLSSDMKNGLYGRTAGKNENPLLMPEARARLEEELRVLQDVDVLDQKYNEIFLREGEESADAFLKKNEQRKEEIMDMLYMPLKKEELQKQRINNALQKEVSSLLSYSGKENKKAAQEAIARAMMEVRRNGSVSEETRKKLFESDIIAPST